jgi:hypothetical protein
MNDEQSNTITETSEPQNTTAPPATTDATPATSDQGDGATQEQAAEIGAGT